MRHAPNPHEVDQEVHIEAERAGPVPDNIVPVDTALVLRVERYGDLEKHGDRVNKILLDSM